MVCNYFITRNHIRQPYGISSSIYIFIYVQHIIWFDKFLKLKPRQLTINNSPNRFKSFIHLIIHTYCPKTEMWIRQSPPPTKNKLPSVGSSFIYFPISNICSCFFFCIFWWKTYSAHVMFNQQNKNSATKTCRELINNYTYVVVRDK